MTGAPLQRPSDAATPLARPAGAGLEELLSRPLTEAELDRATAALAAPIAGRGGAATSVLVIRAGGELLALPSTETAKVVRTGRVHRVPHRSNDVFLGITNHDGEILLCASLEHALGLAPPDGADRPATVVIGGTRDRWAFRVDAVLGVADVPDSLMREPPMTVSAARNGCVRSLARLPEGEASVLDARALAALFRGALG